MNTASSTSRILLLAERRTPPGRSGVRIQRYRLARVPRGARPGETGPRLVDHKRA